MPQGILAFFVAVVAGASGAVAVHLLSAEAGPRGDPVAEASPAPPAAHADVLERLDRIERLLDRAAREAPAPALVGSAPALAGTGASAQEEAMLARLESRMAAALAHLEKAREEEAEARTAGEARRATRAPVPLAEAAREIGLSAREEQEVARIYEEHKEKLYGLLAEPDGDPVEIRREVEAAQGEIQQRALMMKYLPKALPKLGDFMALEVERQSRLVQAVGDERAARLEASNVREANVVPFRGGTRVEWRGGR